MATNTTLNIDTIYGLEEDFTEDIAPFLLILVQGVEGVSIPFVYDVTLYRPEDLPEVDVATLINTGSRSASRTRTIIGFVGAA
jgi:hypothetical protein